MKEIRLPFVDELKSVSQRSNLTMQGASEWSTIVSLIKIVTVTTSDVKSDVFWKWVLAMRRASSTGVFSEYLPNTLLLLLPWVERFTSLVTPGTKYDLLGEAGLVQILLDDGRIQLSHYGHLVAYGLNKVNMVILVIYNAHTIVCEKPQMMTMIMICNDDLAARAKQTGWLTTLPAFTGGWKETHLKASSVFGGCFIIIILQWLWYYKR